MSKQINFKIDKQGKVHIDVTGVDDATCADLTRAFESALGIVESVSHKPEFYVELDDITAKIYETGE